MAARKTGKSSKPTAQATSRPRARSAGAAGKPVRAGADKPTRAVAGKPTRAVAGKPARAVAGKPAATFAGFDADLFVFLRELTFNNEREWFESQRERYERSVRQPALAFLTAVGPEVQRVLPSFVADPRPVGGSLMRIHRDVRFASDKSPYKTNIGMHIRHVVGKDIHAPGVYVHLDADECFLGVGLWHPEGEVLAAVRRRIVERPSAWTAARNASAFRNAWKLHGDSLVRVPKGFDPAHPHADDLRRKDHLALSPLTFDEVRSAGLPKLVSKRLDAARSYVQFLCDALDLPV